MSKLSDFPHKAPSRVSNDVRGVARKYQQMGREISQVTDEMLRINLQHTHSKLGIFIEGMVGIDAWRSALHTDVV